MEIQKFYGDYLIAQKASYSSFAADSTLAIQANSKRLSTIIKDSNRICRSAATTGSRSKVSWYCNIKAGTAASLESEITRDNQRREVNTACLLCFPGLYSFCLTDVVYSEGTPEAGCRTVTTLESALEHCL